MDRQIAGETREDERLWHTYMFWAKEGVLLLETQSKPNNSPIAQMPAIVDSPDNRVDEVTAAALRSILFSAFALEYRLKRALVFLKKPPGSHATLKPLVSQKTGRDSGKELRKLIAWTGVASVERLLNGEK